jgi:hypothetical protein
MESEAPSAPEITQEAPPEPQDFPSQPAVQVVPVEFVIDSHRINAEIRHPGAPRRLVDYLNAVDGPRINLYNCAVGQSDDKQSVGQYEDAQLFRNAIIIAIPRGNITFTATSLEVVHKRPVPTVLVVPGYDVKGNLYMVPEIDPRNTPLIGGHQFVPMTDATITPAGNPEGAWQEPLVIVNMARTLVYIPK